MIPAINQSVVDHLVQIADLLQQQRANPFRVSAFRNAAQTIMALDTGLDALIEDKGFDGLKALPDIGLGIATVIYEIVATGQSGRLQGLRGALDPEQLFQAIPGVGPALARRIHDELQVETLESLELAAYDGRLQNVPGVGPRRAAAIRAALAQILGRKIRPRPIAPPAGPSVETLLDVDLEYRAKAQADKLPTIAPRRFNPRGEAWLPILHTSRGEYHFTALYSNTYRAHQLNRSRDWVIVFFYDHDFHEYQHTIVTETHGALTGKRVVRGRERECLEFYTRLSDGIKK